MKAKKGLQMTDILKRKYDTLEVDNVEIHELAHLTPTMTESNFKSLKLSINDHGQELPIVMYKGKCIDGRHRIRALRELGIKHVYYINEDSHLSIADLRIKILGVYENRRHETPTQRAIIAYREYNLTKASGDKTGQGSVAETYGTTVKQIGRAKRLHELAGNDIIEMLFNGNKINIGTVQIPNNTDSLDSLIKYFSKRTEMIIEQSEQTGISEDYTDEELLMLDDTINKLQSEYSVRMLRKLNKKIFAVVGDHE